MKASYGLLVKSFETARRYLVVYLNRVIAVRDKCQIKPSITGDVVHEYMNFSPRRQKGLDVGNACRRLRYFRRRSDACHQQGRGKNQLPHHIALDIGSDKNKDGAPRAPSNFGRQGVLAMQPAI
jgi:hypothetical protein